MFSLHPYKRACVAFTTALMLCLLSGCFVPDKYTATLYFSEKAYTFEFIGELYMMLLYSDAMYEQSLDPKLVPQQIMSEFTRVIKERKHTRMDIERAGQHTFRTAFAYSSPYAYPEATGLFNFKVEGKRLTVTSRYMSPEDKALVAKNNIPSRGTLAIKVYGTIIESNAHEPATPIKQYSVWHLKDLDEPVRMVIDFDEDIITTIPK